MKAQKNIFRLGLVTLVLILVSVVVKANTKEDSTAIKQVMDAQEKAWNNGDLEGFMQGYWKSEKLRFISKNGVTYGWQNTFNNYKKAYPDKETMGTLTFEIISIESLGGKNFHAVGKNPMKDDPYMVVGKWQTSGTIKAAQGHFTLIFKKIDGRWVIVSDHTS